MKFTPLPIKDAFIVELEKHEDERGFLARSWDREEFRSYGIDLDLLQGYTCWTKKKGTIRGLHYLEVPETKITRVTRGKLYEVIVDLDSKQWFSAQFSADDYKMLIIPQGCAHAVLTLEGNTEYIAYYSSYYDPAKERGIRFDDPALTIKWPIPVTVVSEKDCSWPDYDNR